MTRLSMDEKEGEEPFFIRRTHKLFFFYIQKMLFSVLLLLVGLVLGHSVSAQTATRDCLSVTVPGKCLYIISKIEKKSVVKNKRCRPDLPNGVEKPRDLARSMWGSGGRGGGGEEGIDNNNKKKRH